MPQQWCKLTSFCFESNSLWQGPHGHGLGDGPAGPFVHGPAHVLWASLQNGLGLAGLQAHRTTDLNISVMTQILGLSQKETVSCLMFKPQDFLALIKAQGLSSQHYLPVFQFERLMVNASLLRSSKKFKSSL